MVELEEIKKIVERRRNINDLAENTPGKELPIWRGMYCAVACETTKHSKSKIGKLVGLKHATVMYWEETIKDIFLTRKDVKRAYWEILSDVDALKRNKKGAKDFDDRAESIIKKMLLMKDLEKEEEWHEDFWYPAKGTAEGWQVTKSGKCRRKVGNSFTRMNPSILGDYGYVYVGNYLLHRIVAMTFLENPDPLTHEVVRHKDGDKTNNHVDNLEWAQRKDIIRERRKAKKNKED